MIWEWTATAHKFPPNAPRGRCFYVSPRPTLRFLAIPVQGPNVVTRKYCTLLVQLSSSYYLYKLRKKDCGMREEITVANITRPCNWSKVKRRGMHLTRNRRVLMMTCWKKCERFANLLRVAMRPLNSLCLYLRITSSFTEWRNKRERPVA